MDEFNLNKSVSKQDDKLTVLKQNREDYTEDDFDIEDKCYSKITKRWLRRLRCDGVAVGETIPTLAYELKKPEKKRTIFTIFSVILGVLLAIFVFYSVSLIVTGLIPYITALSRDASKLDDNALANVATLGFLNLFTGTIGILGLCILIVVLLFAFAFIGYFAYFIYSFAFLSNCSVQEMAKGTEVRELLTHIIILLVLSLAFCGLFIYGFVTGGQITSQVILFFVIGLALVSIFTFLLVSIIKQKKEALEIFNTLPQEDRDDYVNHVRAIERTKRRIKRFNRYLDGQSLIN